MGFVSQWFTVDRVGWMLVHSVWQGSLIAVLLAGAMFVLRNRSAKLRYVLSCVAMALCILAPVLTAAMTSHPSRSMLAAVPPNPPVNAVSAWALEDPANNTRSEMPAELSFTQYLQQYLPYTVYLWLAGVGILCFRMSIGFGRVQAWKGDGYQIIDERWSASLSRCAKLLGLSRSVLLLQSARVAVPMTVGFFKPAILIPASLACGLTPLQVQGILAHELAHIRRHDYLINLIQSICETLLFFHPAVRWIGQTIRQERENCCDDLAAVIVGSPRAYAETLVRLEELCNPQSQLSLAFTGGRLLPRIERLLGKRPARFAFNGHLAAMVVGLIIVALSCTSIGSKKTEAATSQPSADPSSNITADDFKPMEEFRFGENDLLSVIIHRPDATKVMNVRVRKDGNIQIGNDVNVKAIGQTPDELRKAIVAALPGQLSESDVLVQVQEMRSRTFSITGAVQRPGQYTIVRDDMTLWDALMLAGDSTVNDTAVWVVRRTANPEAPRKLSLSLQKLRNERASYNICLRANDLILVRPLPVSPVTGKATSQSTNDDVIEPGKRIDLIVVGKQNGVQSDIHVSSEGKINVNGLGELTVKGLTASQAEASIEKKFAEQNQDVTAQISWHSDAPKPPLVQTAPPSPPGPPSPPLADQQRKEIELTTREANRQALLETRRDLERQLRESRSNSPTTQPLTQEQRATIEKGIAEVREQMAELRVREEAIDTRPGAVKTRRSSQQELVNSIARLQADLARLQQENPLATVKSAELEAQIAQLQDQLQLREIAQPPLQPTTNPTEVRPPIVVTRERVGARVPGEYYITGEVPRIGVYSLAPFRSITVAQALIAAGANIYEIGDKPVKVIRRTTREKEEIHQYKVKELYEAKEAPLYVEPNDMIIVGDGKQVPAANVDSIKKINEMIADRQAQLARDSMTYGPNHPMIVELKQQIAALENKVKQLQSPATAPTTQASP